MYVADLGIGSLVV